MKTQSTYYANSLMFQGTALDIMGTRLEALIVGLPEKKAFALWGDITKEVNSLDKMFNRFDPASEVSRINAGLSDDEVSDEMRSALNLCESYLILTSRLFDISRGGRRDLDFGGFAKGYALRKIAILLKAAKVKDAFINFGNSSIMGIGHHPYGDCWKVTLTDPYTDDELEEYELRGQCLSTSGNSPEYTGHIINPLTGRANEECKLATAIAADPLDAEILSTVLMIADPKQTEYIQSNFPKAQFKIYDLQQQ